MSSPFEARRYYPVLAALALTLVQGYGAWFDRDASARKIGGEVLQPIHKVELLGLDLDYHFRAIAHPADRVDPDLVLVALDDEAIRYQRAHYAFNWEFWADLLNRIGAQKPRAIFFDMDLSRVNPVQGFHQELAVFRDGVAARHELKPDDQQTLDSIVDRLDFGGKLASALAAAPIILPIDCLPNTDLPDVDEERARQQDDEATKMETIDPRDDMDPHRSDRLDLLRPELATKAVEIAQSCEFPDFDQRLRSDSLVVKTIIGGQTRWLPSAPLVMARRALGLPEGSIHVEDGRVTLGSLSIPIDDRGQTLIPYAGAGDEWRGRGRQGSPDYYTAVGVLHDDTVAAHLTGKIVFVGLAGLVNQYDAADAKATPFGFSTRRTPGVEKIAVETDAILRQSYLARRPPYVDFRWRYLLTAILGVLGSVAGFQLQPRSALASIFGGCAALILGGAALFTWGGVWIDAMYPTASFGATLAFGAGLRYYAQEGEKRYLREAFSKYLDPKMVDRLLANQELKLFGEEKELTILFADLRGFTSTSERATPAQVVALLNEHLSDMSEVVRRHGGTLDKFIGDCVMAFWGAPIDDPQHAQRACDAAIDMLATMDRRNQERRTAGKPTVDMGVGINSGRVVVGNMGSTDRFDYTVIGDAVNLASRLEGLTKVSPSRVLVGERTAELAGKELTFVPLGLEKVKGKAEPVKIFGLEATMRPQESWARA